MFAEHRLQPVNPNKKAGELSLSGFLT